MGLQLYLVDPAGTMHERDRGLQLLCLSYSSVWAGWHLWEAAVPGGPRRYHARELLRLRLGSLHCTVGSLTRLESSAAAAALEAAAIMRVT